MPPRPASLLLLKQASPLPSLVRRAPPPPHHTIRCPYARHACGVPQQRGFTTSRCLGSNVSTKNHYERLKIHHDATPSEIKRSFYQLSKVHHPDANRNDPSAAATFALLSESYTVLSDPPRRAAYDRDVLRLQHYVSSHSAAAAASRGSYHSSGSAGGRPASGLSKRRGTFRGPPPSFYRSGGWGDQTEKRRKAHEESTGSQGSGNASHRHDTANERANPWSEHHRHSHHGGMGPGSDPFGHREDVPHFDRQATQRTQTREDKRRWDRGQRAVGDDDIEFEPQMSLGAHFFVIIGILATSFLVPMVYLQLIRTNRRNREGGSYTR